MKPMGLNTYKVIDDSTCEVLTTKGDKFLISPESIPKIREYTWSVHSCKRYVVAHIKGERVFLHNFLILHEQGYIVDHINGDSFDYRLGNLRLVERHKNRYNLKQYRNNKLFRGVSYNSRTKKYIARIQANHKSHFLGAFSEIEQAVNARILAEEKYFGEYRRYK